MRFITVFSGGTAGVTVIPAPDAVAGDKVVQVFVLNSGTTQEVTGFFGPVIPANGFIAQITAFGSPLACIALLERG